MGLFDEIRWDAALPEGRPPDSRLFQTKSLDYPSWDYYVVTPEGRLLLIGNGFEDDAGLSADTDISKGIEVEFHPRHTVVVSEGTWRICGALHARSLGVDSSTCRRRALDRCGSCSCEIFPSPVEREN